MSTQRKLSRCNAQILSRPSINGRRPRPSLNLSVLPFAAIVAGDSLFGVLAGVLLPPPPPLLLLLLPCLEWAAAWPLVGVQKPPCAFSGGGGGGGEEAVRRYFPSTPLGEASASFSPILKQKGDSVINLAIPRAAVPGFRFIQGLSCVIGPLGRQRRASTIGQHCPQMTRRPGIQIRIANSVPIPPPDRPCPQRLHNHFGQGQQRRHIFTARRNLGD